jgi:two-component system response regulator
MGKLEGRRKVLIVDDQELMRLLLAQYVEQDLGAEVTLAGTCEGALRLLAEKTYDAILLDLMMPGIGGVELLRRIRTDSANKSSPVIIVSVLVDAPVEDERMSLGRAKAIGANAVVSKPVDRKALVAAVKAQLRARAGRPR